MLFRYDGPDSDSCFCPATPEQVIECLARGDDYWRDGSGVATVHRHNPGGLEFEDRRYPCLHIVVARPHGVHLVHQGADQVVTAAYNPAQPAGMVEHPIDGRRALFPRSCFVPEADTAAVIVDFLRDGARSGRVMWRRGRFTDSAFAFSDV